MAAAIALFSAERAASILANFDIEAGDRRAAMERQSHASLAVLRKKSAKEVTACSRLPGNAVKDLFNTPISNNGTSLAGSPSSCGAAPIASTSKSEQIEKELFHSEHREDILQTAKKRKRERTADGTISTDNNSTAQGGDSPTKPRKHMRTTSTSHATAPETVVQTGSTASRGASSVYRARPSHVPYGQLNPRLPQTPHLPSLSSGRNATMSRMTATQRRRLPKRNESIQAYSMNGSPLGILEIDVEQQQQQQQQRAKAASQASSSVAGTSEADPLPTTSAAPGVGLRDDGDWELLSRPPLAPTASSSRVSTVSQQYKAHQQRSTTTPFSPTKPLLGSVGGGSTTGKMKAAFASKFGHHTHAQGGPFSPSKQQFTMQVPNDASKGRKEWDAWTEAFKRDLGNMSGLSAQDKKILEDRLKQMGLS